MNKKLLIAAAIAACFVLVVAAIAMISGKNQNDTPSATETTQATTETPQTQAPTENRENEIPDGEYAAEFSAEDFQGDILNIQVWDYDAYDPAYINALKEGDSILVCSQPVAVETIQREDRMVLINGGHNSDGITLMQIGDTYRTVTDNDHPIYYDLGQIALSLSSDCVLEDHNDLEKEPEGVTYAIGEILPAVQENPPFNSYNTRIVVKDGQIVKILRFWIP